MALAQSGGGGAMVRAWVTTGICWRAAGWCGLIACTLLLASLFNVAVTNGTSAIEQTGATGSLRMDAMTHAPFVQSRIHEGTNRHLSAATAALADGDNVRARFLASVRAQGLGPGTHP
jgi:hypothetical protein